MKEDIYRLCECGSGAKFKFCCYPKFKELKQTPGFQLLRQSLEFEVHDCWVSEGWQNSGLATLGVARRMASDRFLFGFYTVDAFCLGLKDSSYEANISAERLEEIKSSQPTAVLPITYEEARSLILGGVEYAENMGFKPHFEWNKLKYLVEHERDYQRTFCFGKDGRPHYVPAPHDDPRKFLKQLEKWAR